MLFDRSFIHPAQDESDPAISRPSEYGQEKRVVMVSRTWVDDPMPASVPLDLAFGHAFSINARFCLRNRESVSLGADLQEMDGCRFSWGISGGRLFMGNQISQRNIPAHTLDNDARLVLEARPMTTGPCHLKLTLIDQHGMTLALLKSEINAPESQMGELWTDPSVTHLTYAGYQYDNNITH